MDGKVRRPTHFISLMVAVDNPADWTEIFDKFTDEMAHLPKDYCGSSVTSSIADDEPGVDERGEYYDENTLFKVEQALKDTGLDAQQIINAIATMQNYGILFRERPTA